MVSAWMAANRLQLNHAKTEVLWCSSSHRQHQVLTDPVRIGNTDVLPVKSVRDLGVYIDADVTMRAHITTVVRSCFAALRQIGSVQRSLPRHALLTLVCALIVSKVDYCNSVLVARPGIFMIGCSQFSMPPPAWSSRPGGTTTSPHCSGTFTGCASWSTSSSGYVCQSTGVCTAWHRHTSPTTSS